MDSFTESTYFTDDNDELVRLPRFSTGANTALAAVSFSVKIVEAGPVRGASVSVATTTTTTPCKAGSSCSSHSNVTVVRVITQRDQLDRMEP